MSSEEKLVRMLKYVSEHNDFYKKRIKEYGITNPLDITQWPVLTRKELQENRYNMFSDGYKSKYFNQQLRRQSSSGSTGMPVNVYWDYKDWYASNMCLWRKRLDWYDIKPRDKYCVFTLNAFGITPEDGKLYYINNPSNILSFNVSLIHDENGYEQIAERINDFNPDWLYIQPFVLNQLIRAYIKLGIKPVKTIRYIESVGEILTSDLRRRAEKLFCINVTNMYGSEEMNGIAIENPNAEMQILSDNVFLEIKNEKGISFQGDGESIITNLSNFAMPFIRYNHGDCIVAEDSQPYSYISNRRNICHINGRESDCITLRNKRINSYYLGEIIAETNNQYKDIIDSYHYVYKKSQRKIDCMIYTKKTEWYNSIKKTLEDVFMKQVLSNTGVSFEVILNDDTDALRFGKKTKILSIVD